MATDDPVVRTAERALLAALFAVIDAWLFSVISLGGPAGSVQVHPTLNLVSIGAAGTAVLTALYPRFSRQNERLAQTEQLEERNAHLNR